MADTAIATPIEWTTTGEREPTAPPISSTATVDGFRITASNDASWSFIAEVNGVRVVAVGAADYLNPRDDAKLIRAQDAAVEAIDLLREAGAVPA